MKKILITGVNGLVGRHLAAALTAVGHEVFGIVRQDSDPPALPSDRICVASVTDASGVTRIISTVVPETVIHLAAAHGPAAKTIGSARETVETNFTGTLAILDACRAVKAGVILASSSAVYAPSRDPIDEESTLLLDTPYSLSKYGAERSALFFAQRYGVPLTIVRPFHHSGAGQKPIAFASILTQRIARIERGLCESVVAIDNTENRRDYLDVRDVVSAYQLLLRHEMKGEIFNVCSGLGISIRQIADVAVGLSPVPIEIRETESAENSSIIGSHDKLTHQTGWRPQFDFLHDTLPTLLDYWRKQLLKPSPITYTL